jgi:hypothetical protein
MIAAELFDVAAVELVNLCHDASSLVRSDQLLCGRFVRGTPAGSRRVICQHGVQLDDEAVSQDCNIESRALRSRVAGFDQLKR